ncbi:hypothetical protein IW261DRAFT_1575732 [Armillaria novae-zelandiae]|uniref:Uncharacterized protein n=1 Tax=Armillaria novae-zelandiae TaxID=153914 RepID=A0AA39TTV6_9AGAR|nr:hypothetical protein IW261DRAFT_1575732 [Armillaria novae-zelandiae]
MSQRAASVQRSSSSAHSDTFDQWHPSSDSILNSDSSLAKPTPSAVSIFSSFDQLLSRTSWPEASPKLLYNLIFPYWAHDRHLYHRLLVLVNHEHVSYDDKVEETAWANAFLDVVRRAPPIATTNPSPLPPTTQISPSFPPSIRHPSQQITTEKQVFPQEKSSTAERRNKINKWMAQPRDNEMAPCITLNTKCKAPHQAGPESSKKIKISCANLLPTHLSSLPDTILGMTTGIGEAVPADAIPVGYPQDSRPIGHTRVEKDYGPYIESMGAYWRKDVAGLLSQFVFKNPCDNCVGAKTQCHATEFTVDVEGMPIATGISNFYFFFPLLTCLL